MKFTVAAITHTGKIRPTNQDRLLAEYTENGFPNAALLAVADGMGGLADGELASGAAIEELAEWWKTIQVDMPLEEISNALDTVIYEVHRKIFYLSEELGHQMGSTLSLLLLQNDKYLIKQIGDSRIYRLTKGELQQLTTDQTWCNKMVCDGKLTLSQASHHKLRHALVNALGVSEELEIATSDGTTNTGESYLLCSDGFYSEAPLDGIETGLQHSTPQATLQQMLDGILAGSAGDNATAVLCCLS